MKMTVMVIDVIDGAAFRVSSGGTVRLRDVAAPSLLTAAGKEAKARLEELVLHKHVECEELDSDVDGNVVARVWSDGIDVNQALGRGRVPRVGGQGAETLKPAEPAKRVEIELDESAFKTNDAEKTTDERG